MLNLTYRFWFIFKGNSYKSVNKLNFLLFCSDPEKILKTLAPMFEIDFYLPRTFMSVLRIEKLTVVKTKLLPPEVGMAGLYYFFCTEYFNTESDKKVRSCLKYFCNITFTL